MKTIKIIDNILTKNSIKHIKNLLKDLDYVIAYDYVGYDYNGNNTFDSNNMLQGISRNTTDKRNISPSNQLLYTRLNDMGFLITELVCKRLDLKYKRIERFIWNFYKSKEKGQTHIDIDNENYISIIYTLNTSDGYLEIENKKIYDVEDEAKIFKSNIPHRGFGPIKDKFKLNLNIVIEI